MFQWCWVDPEVFHLVLASFLFSCSVFVGIVVVPAVVSLVVISMFTAVVGGVVVAPEAWLTSPAGVVVEPEAWLTSPAGSGVGDACGVGWPSSGSKPGGIGTLGAKKPKSEPIAR